MEREEAKQLLSEFMAAWANWKPEPGELELWKSMLCRFDLGAGRAALAAYWENCKTAKPVAAAFKAMYTTMNPPSAAPVGSEEEANPGGYAGVSVQCVQAPAENLWLLGVYYPLYYGVPRAIPPSDRVNAYASSLREHLTKLHGGQWEIIEGVSISAMEKRKRDLRDEQWR